MKDRKAAPTKCTDHNDALAFRVWANDPVFDTDPLPWKCVAMFRYLRECLDYIAALQDRGVTVIYQSPAHVSEVRPTDDRVVYKAA